MSTEQHEKIRTGDGFIAALDQSGGSSPKALASYGVPEDAWSSEDEMFDLIHQMRTRIVTSDAFTGERVLGAILFEQTMDREVDGRGTADYLWNVKNVVPFLKVDKGLADEAQGVQLMKPMPDLEALLDRAKAKGIFGTKMRSVIKSHDPAGIEENVAQQFGVAKRILDKGLMPIIEPEVDIHSPDKAACEATLLNRLSAHLADLDEGQQVMFKLTLPEEPGFYENLVEDPRVLKVVALSGGYSMNEANDRLAANSGVIASFSRALTETLSAQQSDAEFDAALDAAIKAIYDASVA